MLNSPTHPPSLPPSLPPSPGLLWRQASPYSRSLQPTKKRVGPCLFLQEEGGRERGREGRRKTRIISPSLSSLPPSVPPFLGLFWCQASAHSRSVQPPKESIGARLSLQEEGGREGGREGGVARGLDLGGDRELWEGRREGGREGGRGGGGAMFFAVYLWVDQ